MSRRVKDRSSFLIKNCHECIYFDFEDTKNSCILAYAVEHNEALPDYVIHDYTSTNENGVVVCDVKQVVAND